jgi:beta-glucosidase
MPFMNKKESASIDMEKLKSEPWQFGRDFLWGSATAAHQVEGHCTNNNWYRFESALDEQGRPRILNGQRAGVCCDHWNL